MQPGQYLVLLATDPDQALQGYSKGWEVRDTILILVPGQTLYAFLFRVPLEEPTVAAQVLKTGTGALWIDGCRVSTQESLNGGAYAKDGSDRHDGAENWRYKRLGGAGEFKQPAGRWPPNLLLVHHSECLQEGTRSVVSHNPGNKSTERVSQHTYGVYASRPLTGYAQDGQETIAAWQCHPTCPVGILDRQSGDRGALVGEVPKKGIPLRRGTLVSDTGGASRFYPQFTNLAEAVDWLTRLTRGAP